jgi:hypothetical protein
MDKPILRLVADRNAAPPKSAPTTERAAYVAELRARYLNGTLDEVLCPQDVEVPDSLLQELFPNLFGRQTFDC